MRRTAAVDAILMRMPSINFGLIEGKDFGRLTLSIRYDQTSDQAGLRSAYLAIPRQMPRPYAWNVSSVNNITVFLGFIVSPERKRQQRGSAGLGQTLMRCGKRQRFC